MVAALLLLALGGPSSVAAAPGNNGTIKVHDTEEANPNVKNEPHVDCPFWLEFFFADAFQSGHWWIQEWSPGDKGDNTQYDWEWYEADENGHDLVGPLSLDAGHYKLFWEGRNENNIKHKAFWVDNSCVVAAPGPTPTPTPLPTPTPTPILSAGVTPTPTPVLGKGAVGQPDTSMTTPTTAESDGYLWQMGFAALAGLLAAALVLSPVVPLVRRHIRR